jgi:glutaredoxin-like YruB-family protein
MKKVTIYSTPGCIYCKLAKDFFAEKGVEFTDVDLSADSAKREEMIEKTGQMSVPMIEIEGESEIVIGFDKKKLSDILGV